MVYGEREKERKRNTPTGVGGDKKTENRKASRKNNSSGIWVDSETDHLANVLYWANKL